MNQLSPPPSPTETSPAEDAATPPRRESAAEPAHAATDATLCAYVGYFAGWFDIGRLAASRRLDRAGVRAPLLND